MRYLIVVLMFLAPLSASAQQLRDCTMNCFLEANAHAYKFEPRPDALIILTMNVEGKPTRMLLDTGAMANAFRKQIGVQGKPTEVTSVNKTTLAKLCSVKIESMEGQNAICGVDLPPVIDALMGENYLAQFESVSINYREHVVTFVSRKTNDQ